MNKKITFKYEDKEYTLEYNRDVVVRLEKKGFNISEADSKPINTLETLFKGAFYKNHKDVSEEKALEIYNNIKDRTKLNESLVEMYAEVYKTTIGDTDEDDSKKIEWKMD